MEHLFSLPLLVVALSLVALVSALVLLRSTLSGKSLPGCGPGSSCDDVTTSRWSRLGPIPTTLPGAVLYLAMLACAVILAASNSTFIEQTSELVRRTASSLAFCSLLAAGGAIWFIVLQAFVIRKFCRYCMVTHLSALAVALIVLRAGPPGLSLFIAAALVLGLFIIGQIAIVPKMYAITEVADDDPSAVEPQRDDEVNDQPYTVAPEPVKQEPVEQQAPPPVIPFSSPLQQTPAVAVPSVQAPSQPAQTTPRRIHAAGNLVSLSPHLWPVLGNREATHIIIVQFDYTCHFCRDLHKLLLKAVAERPAELAILLMPVPMDKACNPMVTATPAEHQNGCIYIRYAMALFLAAPENFPEMDRWLFEPAGPWALDRVKSKAERLAGGARAESFGFRLR